MNNLPVIEQIRLRHRPTLSTDVLRVPVKSSDGADYGSLKIKFEWYQSSPLSLAMVVLPYSKSTEDIVWDLSRELAHFAFREPGHEIGLCDITVAVLKPTPVLLSIRDYEDGSWRTFEVPAGSFAKIMSEAARLSPLPADLYSADVPYTRRRP